MNTRTYPYNPGNPRKETDFYKKWGMLASDLAAEEGTTTAAIHMRVRNYGTPFQRKKMPTICEVMTGRTVIDLALELGVTPITIAQRLQKFGDPYYTSEVPGVVALRGTTRAERHWSKTKLGGRAMGTKDGWLHPRHPDYYTWRYKYIQKYCPAFKNTEDKQ